MPIGFVLANPGRKVRRGRKAKRRFGAVRRRRNSGIKRSTGGYMRSITKHGKRVKRSAWRRSGFHRNRPRRKARRRNGRRRAVSRVGRVRRRRNPRRYALSTRVRRNPSRKHAKRRSRRSRNPGVRGLSLSSNVPQILPFSLPFPGIVGKIANGVIQSAAAGGVLMIGFLGSGAIVDKIIPAVPVAGDDATSFKNVWGRPLIFGAMAGLTGGLTAALLKRLGFKNAGLIGTIAAAGAGVRAIGGIIKATLGTRAGDGTFIGDIAKTGAGMADFLQLSDFVQVPTRGMNGLGEDEAFGLDDGSSDLATDDSFSPADDMDSEEDDDILAAY